jgi:FkbM family methyltransferase
VEHYESANVAVRQTNREVLQRDRQAYRERWAGTFWDADGPELRGRLTLNYDDPHRTADRFPREGDANPGAGLLTITAGPGPDAPPSLVWDVLNQALLATERFAYPSPAPPPTPDVWVWLRSILSIQTVIDIGANTGEYAEFLNGFFRPAAIYAFEPLGSCQTQLQRLTWQIPHLKIFQVALDDHAGEETFWENAYGPSSSLLHVSEIHKQAFPHTERESQSTVKVARLDDVLDVDTLQGDILIKIDVQGVEDRVIRGGRAIFSAAAAVLIELSFVQMYEQQPVFDEIDALLRECGLRLAGVKNQIEDPATGQPLFVHCFYRRVPAAPPA